MSVVWVTSSANKMLAQTVSYFTPSLFWEVVPDAASYPAASIVVHDFDAPRNQIQEGRPAAFPCRGTLKYIRNWPGRYVDSQSLEYPVRPKDVEITRQNSRVLVDRVSREITLAGTP